MSSENSSRVRCERMGCDASFTPDDNPEGSCRYHASPIFHDGMKEWSCCKEKSHDFTLFLEIPGCKTGKHTIEKPVLTKVTPSPKIATPTSVVSSPTNTAATSSKETCSRCRQGFFCSDHGSNPNPKQADAKAVASADETDIAPPPPRKVVDINEPQICKNKSCGKTFKEKDNHESACNYHPGPAIFHDRIRGWKCCDVHVKEFDEFVTIPPCAKGWHSADPTS